MAVRSLYRWGIEESHCRRDPTEGFSARRPRAAAPKPYLGAEITRLLAVTPGPRERALLFFAIGSACRRGEIVGVDVEDIDWLAGIVRIRQGKGAKERYVAPGHTALEVLRTYLGERRSGPVFLADGGGRMPGHRAYMLVHAMRAEAGVVGATMHKFRVTAANWLLESGMALDEAQQVMGHSDIATTARYASWSKQARALKKQSALSLANHFHHSGNGKRPA